MSTERFSYKFFTDKWVFAVVIGLVLNKKYNIAPGVITDVYLPFILCAIKAWWTKTSFIDISPNKIVYCHKELATYQKRTFNASGITKIYFKVLFFTTIDEQYCLFEYSDRGGKIKNFIININKFRYPERVRLGIVNFAKKNNITIVS